VDLISLTPQLRILHNGSAPSFQVGSVSSILTIRSVLARDGCVCSHFVPLLSVTKSDRESFGFIAQLVRAPPCHGGGRGFKSHWSRNATLAHSVEQRTCNA
jgi:hypothetical protein